jgi:hypothetical protein
MTSFLFDEHLQALRRNRAERTGWRTFLHERALDDLVDRLTFIQRKFARALVIGWPSADPPGVGGIAASVEWRPTLDLLGPGDLRAFDLLLVLGTVEAANDPRTVFHALRACLGPDGLLLGALVGGDSLPALRRAMLAADSAAGRGAAPRTHPRIEAAAVAGLLTDAGFHLPVVDVDRVELRYRDLSGLVADLRGTAASNALVRRDRRPLSRTSLEAARNAFAQGGGLERIDLVHFAGWTPADNNQA